MVVASVRGKTGLGQWLPWLLMFQASLALADWQREMPAARLVGGGDFTWFGFALYSARLWSPVAPPTWEQPFALELTYHRELTRDTLVQASLDEMRRIAGDSVDETRLARWEGEMRGAFLDVQPGQRITGLYLPGKGCRFYVDEQFHREVSDAAFARAFFAIWLDARSRAPRLRRALLGMNGASE
jgi:hypothetical protein